MTQDELWLNKYQEIVAFIEKNKRNPSKYIDEERGRFLNWLKHNRKLYAAGENDERNFKVKSETENDKLEEGYMTKLKLRGYYANQRMEVKDIYRRFTTASHSWKKFLYNLGVKDSFLQNLEERTLGYRLNEDEASQRLMYKFKKDLLMQLRKEYGI